MKEENKFILTTSIICGVVLIIALAFLFTLQPAQNSIKENTITVQGTSTIKVVPDLISVYFSIDSEGNTTAEANNKNSKILEDFTNELVNKGFDEKTIKTENFNIYPNTYWEDNKMKDDGFKATRSLKVELNSTQFDKISKVIDAGVNAGAGISYINFELSEEYQNMYKAEALKQAAQDAKVKAESTALGFNKKIGSLVSVEVNNFDYYPWPIYRTYNSLDASSAKESVTNINPSDKEVNAVINAVYEIK